MSTQFNPGKIVTSKASLLKDKGLEDTRQALTESSKKAFNSISDGLLDTMQGVIPTLGGSYSAMKDLGSFVSTTIPSLTNFDLNAVGNLVQSFNVKNILAGLDEKINPKSLFASYFTSGIPQQVLGLKQLTDTISPIANAISKDIYKSAPDSSIGKVLDDSNLVMRTLAEEYEDTTLKIADANGSELASTAAKIAKLGDAHIVSNVIDQATSSIGKSLSGEISIPGGGVINFRDNGEVSAEWGSLPIPSDNMRALMGKLNYMPEVARIEKVINGGLENSQEVLREIAEDRVAGVKRMIVI